MADVLKGLSLVCLYCEPWETYLRTSKHHLMRHFSRQCRVLYVEMPAHPAMRAAKDGRWERAVRRWWQGPQEVEENIFVLSPLAPLPYHARVGLLARPWVNRLNQRAVLPSLRRALASLAMDNPVLWFYFPHAAEMIDALPHSLVCYHVVDDFLAFKGIPGSLAEVERRLLTRADLVIASSSYLYERKRCWAPGIKLVRHAVDPGPFEQQGQREPAPPDIRKLRQPILGYFGAIHKLDLDLCREVALRRPDWSIVIVGPVAGHQSADATALGGVPNVRLLGPKRYEDLPSYLAAVDAAIMPFARNPLTEAMSPIKVYEALAAGKPVVSTPIPELNYFGDLVRVADKAEPFIAEIEAALREAPEMARRRRAFARQNTWAHRFQEIETLLGDAFGRCQKPEPAAGWMA